MYGAEFVLLPAGAAAPAAAREVVRQALSAWNLDDLMDAVVLLTSEAVTNAIMHTSGPVSLGVARHEGGVRVRVVDSSVVLPVRRRRSTSATTGRGVGLLEDLADEWGIDRLEAGKVVWFCISAGSGWARFDTDAVHGDAGGAP